MFGNGSKALRRAVLSLTVAALCAGCVSIYRNHGYVPPEDDLAAIKVGVDTRDSVTEKIGTPGASGVLNEGGYYYVTTRFRHYGAREPEAVSRELVAITFDRGGRVRNIERYGLEDGRVIALQRRVTDNGESDKTLIRQLLGNLTRIGPGTLLREE